MKKILLFLVYVSLTFFVNAQHNEDALARQLVTKNAAAIGLSQDDLNNYFVSSSYFNVTGGNQMVYLIQGYKGLPVWNQMLVLSFKEGKLISQTGSFLSDMDKLTNFNAAVATTTPVDAVRTAITECKIEMPPFIFVVNTIEPGKKFDFGKLNMASENVTAELMWVPENVGNNVTAVKLVWQVQLFPVKNADYWNIRVDANSNTVVNKNNLTVYEAIESIHNIDPVAKSKNISPFPFPVSQQPNKPAFGVNNTNSPTLVGTANYTVIPYPAESPIHPGGTAAVRTNPWTLAGGNAVSLGWHNDGTADYITSRGNNVYAQEDRDNNNGTFGIQATSTTSPDPLNFTYAGQPDYTVDPTTANFQQFAITNLFYWNNLSHDINYNYGFTEPAGNFQNSNQGRGGNGNDYVIADAQDAGGTNNANMSTPADGSRPRMQMYLWSPVRGVTTMVVNTPASIAGPYTAVEGAMSTANLLANVGPVTAQVVYYNDDAGGSTHEACASPANTITGKIVLINRGTCTFAIKVKNAQLAGAVAVIMVNNVPGAPIVMGGTDNTITIPAVMISDVDGATIAAQLGNNVNVTLSGTPGGTVQLDGDIDNGIITHEFFHGVSNRLTGGPANSGCLSNAEEGGEGWSDYNALMFTTDWTTALITDGNTKARPIGNYAFGLPVTGAGIRLYPYCTNIAVNPLTYANMGVAPVGTEVHNIGEIWCMALWEMTWSIIQTDGINTNFINANAAGGNTVAYKLVMEGMKLQPCSPGYIDARNAILQADRNLYNGAHVCAIWTAFAKRGMGFSASQGSSNSASDQTAAFDMPPSPVITGQPASVSVCTGANVTFTVTATGNNPTYQWQLSTAGAGGPWNNLANGGIYSGATTATLTLTGVTVGLSGNQYRCVVIGGCPAVNSNPAVLTVGSGAPSITTHPSAASVCAGSNTTFTVAATGTNLTYQWQESTTGAGGPWNNVTNGGVYSGATLATLTLTGVTIAMNNYQYRCNVTGGCNASTVASNPAVLTVFTGGTSITSQPVSSTVCAAGNTTFVVAAAGAGLTYQWQLSTTGAGGPWNNITNGGVYSGATTATLTLTGVTAGMNAYQYRCIVTGSCPPPVTSDPVILTVNTAPSVTAQPLNTTVCITTIATFSVTASGTVPTYQWQESTTGAGGPWNNITNAGIYSGALTNTLTITGVTIGMNNYQYRCVVNGTCSPAATSNAAILTVVSLSTGGSLAPANTAFCSATNNGTITLSGFVGNIIRWESATNLAGPWTNIANTTTTLTYTNLAATTYYRAFVQAAGCAGSYSSTATVQVTALLPMVIVADPGIVLCEGDPTRLTAMEGNFSSGTITTTFTNNNAFGLVIFNFKNNNAFPVIITGIESIASTSGLSTASLYYKTTPIAGAPGAISAANGWIQAATGTYTAVANTTTNTPQVFLSGLNSLSIPAGATYGLAVETKTAAGVGNLRYSTIAAGIYTISAGGCDLITGTNIGYAGDISPAVLLNTPRGFIGKVNFSGGALTPITTGTFLWSPALGLSSTTTNPVAASPANTTTYTVVHNDGAGCVRSANITITVNKRPTITSQPSNRTVCDQSSTTFSVTATGTALAYQWQVSTDGGANYSNLANGAPYAGVNTATLTVNPVTLALSNNRYRCVVTGTCAPVGTANISTGAILTVNGLPGVTVTPTSGCGGVAGINGLLLSTGSAAPPVPGSVTVNSGAISVIVPDNTPAGATHTLAVSTVPSNATLTGVTVTWTMPHTWVGDVVMALKAPNGQILNLDYLISITGAGPSTGFVNTSVSSAGVNLLSTGSGTYTGTFRADGVITNVNAGAGGPTGYTPTQTTWAPLYTTANGNWVLAMKDAFSGDEGTLTSWSIKFDYTTPGTISPVTYTWSPATGLYLNSTTTIPYVAGSQQPSVYAAPTALTLYTVTGTDGVTGCSNTATALVNYTPPAPTIVPSSVTMCLGDPAVKLKSSSTTSTVVTFASGPLTLAVPDNNQNGVSHSINVTGIPANATVTGMKVNMNMPHTFIGDMVFALRAPNGNVLNLDYFLSFSFGGVTTGFTNTTISSTSSAALSSGSNPYTGSFKPDGQIAATANGPAAPIGFTANMANYSQLISSLTSANTNGAYTLAMYDGGALDVGTLTSWSLELTYIQGVPATPAVWSPAAGLFSDANATIPYVAGTAIDSVWTKPTPSGVYPYSATVQSLSASASSITTTFANNNAFGLVIFNFKNNNAYPVTITDIESIASTTGASIATLYYNTTAIAGAPGAISAANGWLPAGTANYTAIANTTTTTPQPFLSGLSLTIPAGATYGIGVESKTAAGVGNLRYSTIAAGVQTISSNGCDFITGTNIGYAGDIAPAVLANTPRGFIGIVRFIGNTGAPCTSPARTVIVTVNQPTTISSQPVSKIICTDKVTTFSVVAAGTGPFSYQWQVSTNAGVLFNNIANGGVYAGATTSTLTITAPPVSMSGYQYRCVITGAAPCASATSSAASLTVNPLPIVVISASPYTSLLPGMITTISSSVTPNAAATYTWLRNGTVVSNAVTGSLKVDVDVMGEYTLRVSDVNGCTNTSNKVTIKDSASGKCFIYPNPNSGMFQVRYYSVASNVLPRSLTVYDAKGDRVLTQFYTIGRPYDRMDVDMRRNGKGLYWVEIGDLNGNRITMCRIVIQ